MKVALITCASYRVNREVVSSIEQEAIAQIRQLCQDADHQLVTFPRVPEESREEFASRMIELAKQDPEALVLHYAGWVEDDTILQIARSFRCPTILWATRDVFKDGISQLVAHVGYMEAASVLRKHNQPVLRHYGGPDGESRSVLKSFLSAAQTLWAMRNVRCASIGEGYGSKGILDAIFDETALRDRLGVQFDRIPLDELFSRYRSVPAERARKEREGLFQGASLGEQISAIDEETVTDSLRLLCALCDIMEERKLGLLSIRCFPEFMANNVPSPCFAVSVLNDMGIVTSCEGDILSGLSMFILSNLSGSPATLMDVFSYDEEASTMDLFHCGAAASAMSAGPGSCKYRTHCKPGNHRPGVTVEFPFREGEVSFLKLDYIDRQFKLCYYRGDCVAPSAPMRGTYATVRTRTSVKQLIESLLDEGISHHQVLSYGKLTREIEFFSRISGLQLLQF